MEPETNYLAIVFMTVFWGFMAFVALAWLALIINIIRGAWNFIIWTFFGDRSE